MTTPTPLHNVFVMFLAACQFNFVHPRRLGRVFGDRTGYRLDDENFFIPDVSYARQPDLPTQFTLAPDLAVEVVSPSNTADEIQVWVVYPASRTITVHTAPNSARTLTETDALDGSDVLPAFALPLAELFAELA